MTTCPTCGGKMPPEKCEDPEHAQEPEIAVDDSEELDEEDFFDWLNDFGERDVYCFGYDGDTL